MKFDRAVGLQRRGVRAKGSFPVGRTAGPGCRVHLWLLRALGDPPDVSSPMLLATAESGRRARSLLKRSLPGR